MPSKKASRRIQLNACLKAFFCQRSNQSSKSVSVNSGTTALGKLLNGRYQIIRVLGAGGSSQTYLARDLYRPSHPTCIVKSFKPASSDPSFLQIAQGLFQAEAEILEKLGYNNQVPQLLAYFEEEQDSYMLQEHIDGKPLSTEMAPGCRWSESQVIQLLQEVLEILVFIHSHEVIHCDIKPDNLIRRKQDNKLVLIDFGSTKQIRAQTVNPQSYRSATTPIGTPGYMAPEQGQGNPRPNSDLYALGIISIQVLTGLAPKQFQEELDTGEICWQQQAKVSSELASFISKLVSYHFKDRYQSATKALEALQPLTKNQSLNPPKYLFSQVEAPSQQLSTSSILLPQVPFHEPNQEAVFSIAPSEQPADSKKRSWIWAGIGTGLASAVALSAGIHSLPDSKVVTQKNNSNPQSRIQKKEPPQTPKKTPPASESSSASVNKARSVRENPPSVPVPIKTQVVAATANPPAKQPQLSPAKVSVQEPDKSVKEAEGAFESKVNTSQIKLIRSLAKLKEASSRLAEETAIAKESLAQRQEAKQEAFEKLDVALAKLQQKVKTLQSKKLLVNLASSNNPPTEEPSYPPQASKLAKLLEEEATPTELPTEEPSYPPQASKLAKLLEEEVTPTELTTEEPSHPPRASKLAKLLEEEVTPTELTTEEPSHPSQPSETELPEEELNPTDLPTEEPLYPPQASKLAKLLEEEVNPTELPTETNNLWKSSNNSPVISPDGQFLVGISANNTIKIWDAHTGELLRTLKGHFSNVQTVTISSDSQTLTSISADNTSKTWNLHTGQLLKTLTVQQEAEKQEGWVAGGKLHR